MDLQFIKKLSILTIIWSALFLAILLTNAISKSTSVLAWLIYSIIIGSVFLGLKLWNRSLQEPLLDTNLTHFEMSISVILAVSVSLFGGTLMQLDLMKNTIWYLLLAFVMTTSQFTLLKVSIIDESIALQISYHIINLALKLTFFCISGY